MMSSEEFKRKMDAWCEGYKRENRKVADKWEKKLQKILKEGFEWKPKEG